MMVVASPDDLVNAVSRDRRMVGYRVRRQGDGWIELEVLAQRARLPVLLVVAWPEVWRNEKELAPDVLRAPPAPDRTAIPCPIPMVRLLLLLRTRADAIAMRMQAAAMELELERSRHEN